MEKTVIVAPKEVLLTRDRIDDQCDWLRREPGSRETFAGNATEALYAFDSWGGKLVTAEGETIKIVPGLFDDVHSENSCGEWVSEQKRRGPAERAPKKTLLSRLHVYDGLARLCSRPIGNAARREEVAKARELLRGLTPNAREHYGRGLRRLRKQGLQDLRYGAAIWRLRMDCSERSERERRDEKFARPSCSDCERTIQRWPEEVGPWCKRCGNPNALPPEK